MKNLKLNYNKTIVRAGSKNIINARSQCNDFNSANTHKFLQAKYHFLVSTKANHLKKYQMKTP